MDTTAALDLAALARPNLTPVLARYFETSWSHGEGHRLFDTSARSYLDFANGIAVTALGHHHPAVTAAIHAQVDRLTKTPGAASWPSATGRIPRAPLGSRSSGMPKTACRPSTSFAASR